MILHKGDARRCSRPLHFCRTPVRHDQAVHAGSSCERTHVPLDILSDDRLDTSDELEDAFAPERIPDRGAFFPVVDEAGILENCEMLRSRRSVDSDHLGELADAMGVLLEPLDDEQA